MTAHALVSGVLYRSPEQRTSKAGKPYTTATIKVRDGDGFAFWRVTAFSQSAQDELARLSDGDALSAQGSMKAELYRPDGGEPRISLSVIADAVLALRSPAKPRQPKGEEKPTTSRRRDSLDAHPQAGSGEAADGLNDEVPF
jgi:single-stranded DNA-binding protein